MTEAGERKGAGGDTPAAGSFWVQFDRELADINATLSRLEEGLPKPEPEAPAERESHVQPKRRRRKPRAAERQPAPEPASETPAPAEPPTPASSEGPAPPAEPQPTGTDLADPKNFGLMPPVANLEQGSASSEDYRKRLGQDLAFANRVLHTSRVPASVWREWRAFERAAQEKLRALTPPRADEDGGA